jgi:hypothetical protein
MKSPDAVSQNENFQLRRRHAKIDPNMTAGVGFASIIVALGLLPHTVPVYILCGALGCATIAYIVISVRNSTDVRLSVDETGLVQSADGEERRIPFSDMKSLKASYAVNRYSLRVRMPSEPGVVVYEPKSLARKDKDHFSQLAYEATRAYKEYRRRS